MQGKAPEKLKKYYDQEKRTYKIMMPSDQFGHKNDILSPSKDDYCERCMVLLRKTAKIVVQSMKKEFKVEKGKKVQQDSIFYCLCVSCLTNQEKVENYFVFERIDESKKKLKQYNYLQVIVLMELVSQYTIFFGELLQEFNQKVGKQQFMLKSQEELFQLYNLIQRDFIQKDFNGKDLDYGFKIPKDLPQSKQPPNLEMLELNTKKQTYRIANVNKKNKLHEGFLKSYGYNENREQFQAGGTNPWNCLLEMASQDKQEQMNNKLQFGKERLLGIVQESQKREMRFQDAFVEGSIFENLKKDKKKKTEQPFRLFDHGENIRIPQQLANETHQLHTERTLLQRQVSKSKGKNKKNSKKE